MNRKINHFGQLNITIPESPYPSSDLRSNSSEITSPVSSTRSILIGDRVLVGLSETPGTVAYIGPTHFSDENMAGIALDSSKGKHDGEIFGIRYFSCAPKHGIFCSIDSLRQRPTGYSETNPRIRIESKKGLSDSVGFSDQLQKQTSSSLTRSKSERLPRRRVPIVSVIGQLSSNTESVFAAPQNIVNPSLRRAYSARYKSYKPKWIPAGSHDLRSSGLNIDKPIAVQQKFHVTGETKSGSTNNRTMTRSCTFPAVTEHRSPNQKLTASNQSKNPALQAEYLSPYRYMDSSFPSSQLSVGPSVALSHKSDYSDRSLTKNVIYYTQDTIAEVQRQIVNTYAEYTTTLKQLDKERQRYEDLFEIYTEMHRSSLHPRHARKPTSSSRVKSKLHDEFEKTKRFLLDIKRLSAQLSNISQNGTVSSRTGVTMNENLPVISSTNGPNLSEDVMPALEPIGTEKNSNKWINLITHFHSRYQSLVESGLQLCIRIHKNKDGQSSKWNINVKDVFENLRVHIEKVNRISYQMSSELMLVANEVAYLSSRPDHPIVNNLQNSRKKLEQSKVSVQQLTKRNGLLKDELTAAMIRMESDDELQVMMLRTNCRIHQLNQLNFKAKALCTEQDQLILQKKEELQRVINEFNFRSQTWADERELRLYANRQLVDHLNVFQDRPQASLNSEQNQRKSVEKQLNTTAEDGLSYPLFNALCTEIRRLQRRTTNLIDALDTLGSGNCTKARLSEIRLLVQTSMKGKQRASKMVKSNNEKSTEGHGTHRQEFRFKRNDHTPASVTSPQIGRLHVSDNRKRYSKQDSVKNSFLPVITESGQTFNSHEHVIDVSKQNAKSDSSINRRSKQTFLSKLAYMPRFEDPILEEDEEFEEKSF